MEIGDPFKFKMGVELKIVEGFEVRFFGTANLPCCIAQEGQDA